MPSVEAIILNYKRRDNIARIVRTCLTCPEIKAIHVIDQASVGERLRTLPASTRVTYVQRPNIGSGRRLVYASRLASDLLIGIDDDVFLTQTQIRQLIDRARQLPGRAHGIWGQDIVDTDEALRIVGGVMNVNRPVDILNRVYAFTPRQARRALALASSLGLEWSKLGQFDDILLSYAPLRRPLCHDLGQIRDCKTSNQVGIAVWKQPDFEENRIAFVEKLRAYLVHSNGRPLAAAI